MKGYMAGVPNLEDVPKGVGGTYSASESRVQGTTGKLRELSGILTNKTVSLKGNVYVTCVRSAMTYGSETWAMNSEQME